MSAMLSPDHNDNPGVIVSVQRLKKSYGGQCVVDNITFDVHSGEIFGLLGPNGAGKTTTIECIEGLRLADDGWIEVLGLDPRSSRDRGQLRERTGVQLQTTTLPSRIRVGEAVNLFRSFYRNQADGSALLELLGMLDKWHVFVGQLSGGQRQRLSIALALINRPEIVFFDELTTGLDPQARHATWDLIRDIRNRGTAVFLTTHFMDEAAQLCDRIAILDRGHLIALDTPAGLIEKTQSQTRITFKTNGALDTSVVAGLDGVGHVEQDGDTVAITGYGDHLVGAVVRALENASVPYRSLQTEQPNLEQAFLTLTGTH
jgi:ABC-2 type transport system ATP-binding protein